MPNGNDEVDEEFVLRMDPRKAVVTASLAMCFVAVGVSMMIDGGILGMVIGGVGVAFFGSGLLILIVAIIHPQALLTIDASGVRFGGIVRSARRSIPWDGISGVRIYRFQGTSFGHGVRMLGFVPANPDSPVWNRGRLSRMSTRMAGVPVSISDRSINLELEQIAQIMQRFKPDLTIDYGEPRDAGFGRLTRPSKWHRS